MTLCCWIKVGKTRRKLIENPEFPALARITFLVSKDLITCRVFPTSSDEGHALHSAKRTFSMFFLSYLHIHPKPQTSLSKSPCFVLLSIENRRRHDSSKVKLTTNVDVQRKDMSKKRFAAGFLFHHSCYNFSSPYFLFCYLNPSSTPNTFFKRGRKISYSTAALRAIAGILFFPLDNLPIKSSTS